jgi:hypothetical protein
MATHSAPIDLYEESHEGSAEEQGRRTDRVATEERRPDANGERDEPAIEVSRAGLDRVLGW